MERTLLQRKIFYGLVAGAIGQLPHVVLWFFPFWWKGTFYYWDFLAQFPLAFVSLSLILVVISSLIAEMEDSSRRRRAFRRLWFYGLVVTILGPITLWAILGSIELLSM